MAMPFEAVGALRLVDTRLIDSRFTEGRGGRDGTRNACTVHDGPGIACRAVRRPGLLGSPRVRLHPLPHYPRADTGLVQPASVPHSLGNLVQHLLVHRAETFVRTVPGHRPTVPTSHAPAHLAVLPSPSGNLQRRRDRPGLPIRTAGRTPSNFGTLGDGIAQVVAGAAAASRPLELRLSSWMNRQVGGRSDLRCSSLVERHLDRER